MKFKIKAYSVDSYESEIEANSEEEAKEKLASEWENSEIEPKDSWIFLENEDGFDLVDSLVSEN